MQWQKQLFGQMMASQAMIPGYLPQNPFANYANHLNPPNSVPPFGIDHNGTNFTVVKGQIFTKIVFFKLNTWQQYLLNGRWH